MTKGGTHTPVADVTRVRGSSRRATHPRRGCKIHSSRRLLRDSADFGIDTVRDGGVRDAGIPVAVTSAMGVSPTEPASTHPPPPSFPAYKRDGGVGVDGTRMYGRGARTNAAPPSMRVYKRDVGVRRTEHLVRSSRYVRTDDERRESAPATRPNRRRDGRGEPSGIRRFDTGGPAGSIRGPTFRCEGLSRSDTRLLPRRWSDSPFLP